MIEKTKVKKAKQQVKRATGGKLWTWGDGYDCYEQEDLIVFSL